MSTFSADLIDKQLPTRKIEDWKYADISFLKKQSFTPFLFDRENECDFQESEKKLVLKIYNTSASAKVKASKLPPGFQLVTDAPTGLSLFEPYKNYLIDLASALNNNHLFAIVGKDFPADVVIEVQMGMDVPASEAYHIYNTHLNFIFEDQVTVKILENMVLKDKYFHLSGVDYFLGKNANVKILKNESGVVGGRGGHTSRLNLQDGAEARITTLTLSSDWSRHNVYAELAGPGAFVGLEAAYLAKEAQFIDHHTVIEHRVGHTTSSQKYNGVLADKAKAVFNGKVVIVRDAQKSSSEQLNRNLLLSKQAEINTKPELQIDADDVQAKHGATVGQLSEEQLFYLLSRGISENVARGMLTRGFIEEIGLNLPEVLQKVFFAKVAGFVHERMEN
jgi:Fe-S cluster assembly protein SufD